MRPQIPGFPDLPAVPPDSSSPLGMLAHAMLGNDPAAVSKLINGKPVGTVEVSWDLWSEAFLGKPIPFEALTVLAQHTPPPVNWISKLYDSPDKTPNIKELIGWWIGPSGVDPQIVKHSLSFGIEVLGQDITVNAMAEPALVDIFSVFHTQGFDWETACDKSVLGPAMIASLSNPDLSSLTDNLSGQSIRQGMAQLFNDRNYDAVVWGTTNTKGPEQHIQAWREWLDRSEKRRMAWEELVEQDTKFNKMIQAWSDTWLSSGSVNGSRLMNWLAGFDRSGNPFDDPVFLGSAKFPSDIDLAKIDIYLRPNCRCGVDVVVDLNAKFSCWVGQQSCASKDDLLNDLACSPSGNVLEVAPNMFSVLALPDMKWFERMITDPVCLEVALPYLSDQRTAVRFLSNLNVQQVIFIAQANPKLWSAWTDQQGANLLLSWHKISKKDLDDEAGMEMFKHFPHWFTQTDRYGSSLLLSEKLSSELKAVVKKKLLTNVSRQARGGQATPPPSPKL